MSRATLNLKWLTILLIVGLIVFKTKVNSQTFTTPEVYSFKQEVFSPLSYYTGQANVSIPLCEINTSDITIPVSLNYIGGEGLRPLNTYSTVGFGWKLSAGGCITRTVNYMPDEAPETNNVKSFFAMPANTVTNSYVRNNVSSYINFDPNNYYYPEYEYSPDIFTFSFLGYSGFFVMGYDGEFKIQSDNIVDVEKFSTSIGEFGSLVYFKLTANDGTRFTFGSTIGSIEFSGGENAIPYQSNAWYLTKIEFTNGREIDFNYHDNRGTRIHFSVNSNGGGYITNSPVVIDNITFDGGEVIFASNLKPYDISGYEEDLKMIDQITLQDNFGQEVKKIDFGFNALKSDRYYMLKSVSVNDEKYNFTYNATSSLPNVPEAYGTDYWGFYNGQDEKLGTVDDGYRDVCLNQHNLTLTEKVPSESHSKIGILTEIKFPTGGTEKFEYEQNTCSHRGMQTLNGQGYEQIIGEALKVGGLRVKSITLDDTQTKNYYYVHSFDPDDPEHMSTVIYKSSGNLYKLPALAHFTGEAFNFLSIEGEPHITYSKVFEYRSDKSYTEYSMYSPLEVSDGDNSQNSNYFSVYANEPVIFTHVSKNAFVGSLGKNSSCALERGKVASIKHYDSSNTLKKSIEYNYTSDTDRYNEYVASLCVRGTDDNNVGTLAFELGMSYLNNSSLDFSVAHSYCIYTFPSFLEEEIVTEYHGNYSIQTTREYNYNDEKLLSETIEYGSDEKELKTVLRYPKDINSGVYATMVSKSMLNYPVEQTNYKAGKVIGGTLTTYKANGSSYVPYKTFSIETSTPLTSITPYNGSSMDGAYGSSPEMEFVSYNTSGKVLKTLGKDGIYNYYVWGYKGEYPITQISSPLNTTITPTIEDNSLSISDDLTDINATISYLQGVLSSYIDNDDYRVNLYTYKPSVGITSKTDANGYTAYYEFDNSGRLKKVKDDNANILSQYEYNVINTFSVSPTSLYFGSDGGTQYFSLKSNDSWSITELPSFVSYVSPTNGTGPTTVAVTCLENSGVAKRGNILFTSGDDETVSITVYQDVAPPNITLTFPTKEDNELSIIELGQLTITWESNFAGSVDIEIEREGHSTGFYASYQVTEFESSYSYDWYFRDDNNNFFEAGDECTLTISYDDGQSTISDQVTFTLVD